MGKDNDRRYLAVDPAKPGSEVCIKTKWKIVRGQVVIVSMEPVEIVKKEQVRPCT